MNFISIISIFTLFISSVVATNCKGCVSLDEYNFDKVVSRFKAVLVKFDAAYPYGDKQETYTKLAEEVATTKDLLIAEVPIKDYGERENEELGKKYGINSKDDLPAVLLFVQGNKNPISFPKTSEWTVDNFRKLIRDNVHIYIGLPGCIEELDKQAIGFVPDEDKHKRMAEVKKFIEKEKGDAQATAKIYLKLMKKIVEQGVTFPEDEIERLNKILKDGKLTDKKKRELSERINILRSFTFQRLKEEL